MRGPSGQPRPAPVLLTGATGFIGRRLQRVLLDATVPVRALVRPGSPNRQHADDRSEPVEASIDDTAALARVACGCRAVVYCAGTTRGRSLADFLPANVDGVRRLLAAMQGLEAVPPFLLISSLAASRPGISDYARSKHLAERTLHDRAPGPWTILRPPAVYGPGDREMRPVLRMLRSGWVLRAGPAGQRVSLLYADDLAAAVLAWLRTWPSTAGGTYAIDDGHPGGYDWPGMVRAAGRSRARLLGIPPRLLATLGRANLVLSRVFGYAPMLTPGKVRELTQPDWLCDNSAFTAATGWRPQTSLAEGLRLTLEATAA